jgi:hypothetical protein
MDVGEFRNIQDPATSRPDVTRLPGLSETDKMEDISNAEKEQERGKFSHNHRQRTIGRELLKDRKTERRVEGKG